MRPLVKEALNVAVKEVGVREVGNNGGKRVSEYLRSTGLPPGNPWCLAFCFWAAERAAQLLQVRNPLPRVAYCPYLAKWAEEQGYLRERPDAGDLFLRYGRTRAGVCRAHHVGFVVNVDGDDFATVEGNTNLAGSAEGIGVFKRCRKVGSEYRFVRWAEACPTETSAAVPLVVNGKPVDVGALLVGGQAWVPVRAFASLFGVAVSWDGEAQAVRWNGELLPVETVVEAGVSRAPVRDLAEVLGGKVTFDAEGRKVLVDMRGKS